LVRAIEAANQRIYDAANADPRLKGMGTTMVCLLETGRDGIIANVGDSRAWRLLGETLEQLTQDQSWVNEVGRPLGISEENLRVHPMRHVLTMALGVGREVRVQVLPVEMPPGSLVLLSSDGLHGVISEEEIRETLLHPISLEHRAHLLIEAAKDAGGPDNITVVLIQH
jgi:protein phosphatase